jgi:hypothetical protein
MLIGLLMTAVERTCLVEAEHPLVIEAQQLASANDMAGVVILTRANSEECQLLIASHPQPADTAESAKSAATKPYDWWNSPADHGAGTKDETSSARLSVNPSRKSATKNSQTPRSNLTQLKHQ